MHGLRPYCIFTTLELSFPGLKGIIVVHVTMVKKRLSSGEFCAKCRQIEELIKKRGYWDRINEVVIAEEGDNESPGMKLASEYGVETAPFFVVNGEKVYTSALQLINTELKTSRNAAGTFLLSGALEQLREKGPEDIVAYALNAFGTDCGIAFSGAEDVVLIHMAVRTGLPFSAFCLDTGRLYPETYRFIDRVRKEYGVDIMIMAPDRGRLEPFVSEKGLFSFYSDGHGECCGIRKVEPLRRALGGLRAWITGQRKDQNPSTRSDVPVVQEDPAFKGAGGKTLVKFNPLSDYSLREVWNYIRDNDVPVNELHDRGFISIGCEPCTRAVRPGEHERAGRWWWEEETKKECGLHVSKG